MNEVPKPIADVDAVAIQCSTCGTWSTFNIKYNDTLPKGWIETNNGYYCSDKCKKKRN